MFFLRSHKASVHASTPGKWIDAALARKELVGLVAGLEIGDIVYSTRNLEEETGGKLIACDQRTILKSAYPELVEKMGLRIPVLRTRSNVGTISLELNYRPVINGYIYKTQTDGLYRIPVNGSSGYVKIADLPMLRGGATNSGIYYTEEKAIVFYSGKTSYDIIYLDNGAVISATTSGALAITAGRMQYVPTENGVDIMHFYASTSNGSMVYSITNDYKTVTTLTWKFDPSREGSGKGTLNKSACSNWYARLGDMIFFFGYLATGTSKCPYTLYRKKDGAVPEEVWNFDTVGESTSSGWQYAIPSLNTGFLVSHGQKLFGFLNLRPQVNTSSGISSTMKYGYIVFEMDSSGTRTNTYQFSNTTSRTYTWSENVQFEIIGNKLQMIATCPDNKIRMCEFDLENPAKGFYQVNDQIYTATSPHRLFNRNQNVSLLGNQPAIANYFYPTYQDEIGDRRDAGTEITILRNRQEIFPWQYANTLGNVFIEKDCIVWADNTMSSVFVTDLTQKVVPYKRYGYIKALPD